MHKPFFFLLALLSSVQVFGMQATLPDSMPGDRTFLVQINKNVELLGFVYFLGYEGAQAETPGYATKNKTRYAYGLDLYQQYKAYGNSKHLAVAVGFAQNIWLDDFISLLVQLEDFPNAKLHDKVDSTYYSPFSASANMEEARKNASAFIEAMNQLYREVDFDTYLRNNKEKYDAALSQVRSGLPDRRFIPAMEGFYQAHLDQYTLVPSLTIPPGMGFGIKYQSNKKTFAFHVFGSFGPPKADSSGKWDMGFGDKTHLLELSTHEFGHSFVNPVIDQLPQTLIAETQSLFEPIMAAQSGQGYTKWKSSLYEHFVRAGEIVIARNLGNAGGAARLEAAYLNERKFIYLPVIIRELEKYNSARQGSYKEAVGNAMKALAKLVK